jgi:soluble lytic murein transglycosylase-like protein
MHRRHAKRRLTRVGVAVAMVFGAALLLSPERAPRVGPVKADKVASLPLQPVWRPAGDVLRRRAPSPSLPFAMDPRVVERQASLTRWHRIYTFSTRYRIAPDLSRKIYDAAIAQGIEPELAFRLVRVESVFNPRAISPVGAIGLTQLMLGTAREFEPGVTREQLLDPETNLRIGFRYLRGLIREHKGNLRLALLTYNRGPVAVRNALASGLDPANGYEVMMLKGYRGRGTLD